MRSISQMRGNTSKILRLRRMSSPDSKGKPKRNVPGPEKKRRAAEIAALAHEMQQEYLARFVGKEQEVLLEERDDSGKMLGYTTRYQRVAIEEGGKENCIVRAFITEVRQETLQARLIEK